MTGEFQKALAAIDAGDAGGLRAILMASPRLVLEKGPGSGGAYDGYFAGATLLHHVAGNPVRCPLPEGIVEVARVLLEAGADVHAPCGGGPAQPGTHGGTVLELVASSAQAAGAGLAGPLIDLLLDAGADLERGGGAVLWTALYHVVECRKQRDVARHLHDRGAPADLAYAAGLGLLDVVRGYFRPDGSLREGAYRLYRQAGNEIDGGDRAAVVTEALVYACMNGRDEVAAELLDRGAGINGIVPIARWRITPLHGAAWAGWPELCRDLLRRGADPTLRDEVERGTAVGWAAFCKRTEALEALLEDPGKLDLLDALEHGFTERVVELIGLGDPDDPVGGGSRGELLRAAARLGNAGLAAWLLQRGANPNLTDGHGKSALDYAMDQGHQDVANLLLGREPDAS